MIKAKKSLGQNFLTDQNIIDKILNIVDIENINLLPNNKIIKKLFKL